MKGGVDLKFAYNTLVYGDEPIEKGIKRISEYGYDGVEFVGEPERLDINMIKGLLKKYGIKASSICSIYDEKRDLVHPDLAIRKNAINYVKNLIKMAVELQASVVIVRPSPCMKTVPLASPELEWEWAVTNIRECGDFAKEQGIVLAIEAWNRYETYFINRLDEALKLCNDVNLPNVGVMGDTFHMNIEEADMAEAIRGSSGKLVHLHVADSNRAAPGRGHIGFEPIVRALKDINYSGYLSFELLPAAADPFRVLKEGGGKEFFDQYTRESIQFMKEVLRKVQVS